MASPNTERNTTLAYSDLYTSPKQAMEALCEVVHFDKDKTYFEPCSGIGSVSNYFKDNLDITMDTNELFGYSDTTFVEDFLAPRKNVCNKWDYDIIVTNPPYKLAQEFIQEGYKYAKVQYHLLRLNFLEGKKRKKELFSQKHLKRVFIFSYRISCAKGVMEIPQANAVAYCWMEFDRDYIGNPELVWL